MSLSRRPEENEYNPEENTNAESFPAEKFLAG